MVNLFPVIDPANVFAFSNTKLGESNFQDGMLPMLWTFILIQVGAALATVGIMDAVSAPPQTQKDWEGNVTKTDDASSDEKPKKATKKPTKKSTKSDE